MNLNQFLNEHFEDYIYLYKASTGEFPQPDCDKKWSVKLLKKEGII